MQHSNTRRGFTLIELLVVVLIIGILAAIALPQYQLAVDKAKYATLMPLIRAVKDAQEIYYLSHGEYTTNLEELDIKWPWETTTSPQGDLGIRFSDQAYVVGYIYVNNKQQNAFVLWYDHWTPGRRQCMAYAGARSERLCKAIAGKTLYDSCDGTCKAVVF